MRKREGHAFLGLLCVVRSTTCPPAFDALPRFAIKIRDKERDRARRSSSDRETYVCDVEFDVIVGNRDGSSIARHVPFALRNGCANRNSFARSVSRVAELRLSFSQGK